MKKHSLLFILIFFACHFKAQTSDELQLLIENKASEYLKFTGDHAAIFNGKDQPILINNVKSAYLRKKGYVEYDYWGKEAFTTNSNTAESYAEGKLLYDGKVYPQVSMRLDLYTDDLMVLTPNITYGIILDPERVGYAEFNGYHILYIQPGKSSIPLPKGYYQQLYNSGKITILRKESFSFDRANLKLINWSRKYYIYKDGICHTVKNKKNVLNAFKSHKKELDQFIKNNRIDFKKNMEDALIAVTEEYNKLNKN